MLISRLLGNVIVLHTDATVRLRDRSINKIMAGFFTSLVKKNAKIISLQQHFHFT